jgi:hypothetical protein
MCPTYLWGDGEGVNEFISSLSEDPFGGGFGVQPSPVASGGSSGQSSLRSSLEPQAKKLEGTSYVGQPNRLACGAAAAFNALIGLRGDNAKTKENQALFEKISENAIKRGGMLNSEIVNAFNKLAEGSSYKATNSKYDDAFTAAKSAVDGSMPFIGFTRYGDMNHAVLYVPRGDGTADVISSVFSDLEPSGSVYTWIASPNDVAAGLQRSQPSGSYSIITIGTDG